MEFVVLVVVAWLAFANGANDNFKGVATLYGSGAASYRTALSLATVATLGGSLVSIVLASGLVAAFSGSGLVSTEVAASAAFTASVGGSAAVTILLATRLGMPTSTTHALTGALLGVAFVVDGGQSAWAPLVQRFLLPLLLSPLVAIALTGLSFAVLGRLRRLAGGEPVCVCETSPEPALAATPALASAASLPSLVVDQVEECERAPGTTAVLARSDRIAGGIHALSAASVCFARAVNDTPKVAALLATSSLAGGSWSLALVVGAMVVGGLVASRRVAETISHRITSLDPVEGLSANLVTSALVIAASRYGLPVSTTHVSCGSIFGIGIATRSACWPTITKILAAWATTLPLAALLGALLYRLARSMA